MRQVGSLCCAVLWSIAGLGAASTDDLLLQAVKNGSRDAVRTLLTQPAAANATEPDGTTALHWAVQADDVETARLLLRAGANVKAANRYGVTPLALAATNGSAVMLEALLKAGASANTALPEGETVLMTAARTGNAAALRVLLDHGAEVNAREGWLGENALMWAAAENHAAAVRFLVQSGADPNARSKPVGFPRAPRTFTVTTKMPRGGWTALMYAARQGALDAARALADAGVDLNLADSDGTTALVLAIINAQYDVAAMLLDKGADPNIADEAGMGALYAAVDMHTQRWMFGRPAPKPNGTVTAVDLVRSLLTHGANTNARLKRPILARHHDAGDPTLGQGTTPFIRATKTGDITLMQVLLEAGADPHLTQQDRTTALMVAAGVGWRDPRGDGPRIAPITETGSIEAIKVCLDRGLDVNAFNTRGDTAMHGAAVRGADRVVKFLADRNARLDIKNKAEQTPLDVALKRRDPGIAVAAPRESTAILLRQLMSSGAAQPPSLPQ